MTVEDIKIIRSHLSLEDPCDVAIYVCIVVVFYYVAHLGEFTAKSIKPFSLNLHITRRDFVSMRDQNDLPVLKCTLPKTKCEPINGEEV